MSDRYFLDTNVFVYCFDRSDRKKQQRAEQLVGQALADHLGVISSQVVQEFLNVATRKFKTPMTAREAGAYLDSVLVPLCEVFPSFALYAAALKIQEDTGFSFYDALALAGAVEAQCRVFYSEDLQSGRTLGGLKIQNPFANPG